MIPSPDEGDICGRRRMKKLALSAGVVALVSSSALAVDSYEVGDVCVEHYQDPASCTANDVRIEEFIPLSVIEDCEEVVDGEAEMLFQVVVQSADDNSGSPDRYDLGVFISLDEDSAEVGQNCFHTYFPEPLTGSPTYTDNYPGGGDGVDDIVDGDWPDIDDDEDDGPDLCGDIRNNSQLVKTIVAIRFACVDRGDDDGGFDGEADLSWCVSWGVNSNNEGGEFCTGVMGAVPTNPAKCSCGVADLGIPVPVELESFSIER
jgi:hypothetical protein